MRELARHEYELSPGSLYPTLHSLEREGYLQKEIRVVEGPQRKYYQITGRGRSMPAEARGKIAELVDEVLEREGDA